MSLLTTIYKFIKPELTDSPPDITTMNPNWDAIDAELKRQDDAHIAHLAETAKLAYYRLTTNQSIPNNVFTELTLSFPTKLNNENFTQYDGGIKVLTDGIYLIVASIRFAANASGKMRQAALHSAHIGDITANKKAVNTDGGNTEMQVMCLIQIQQNDVVKLSVKQDSGSALDVVSCPLTTFNIKKVG